MHSAGHSVTFLSITLLSFHRLSCLLYDSTHVLLAAKLPKAQDQLLPSLLLCAPPAIWALNTQLSFPGEAPAQAARGGKLNAAHSTSYPTKERDNIRELHKTDVSSDFHTKRQDCARTKASTDCSSKRPGEQENLSPLLRLNGQLDQVLTHCVLDFAYIDVL